MTDFVNIYDTEGKLRSIAAAEVPQAQQFGWKMETPEQAEARVQEEKYGGTAGEVKAGLAGAARGATFGLSDLAMTELGGVDPQTLRYLEETNPMASTAGEVAGVVGSSLLLPGGGAVGGAAKLATLAERGMARALPAAGGLARRAAAKAVQKGVGAGLEGALYGTGELISENALGTAEMNAENLLAFAGSGAMFGAGIGGALGIAGEGVASVAKGLAKKAATKMGRTDKSLADRFGEAANKKAVDALHPTASDMRRLAKRPGQLDDIGNDLLGTQEALGGKRVLSRTGDLDETLDNVKVTQEWAGKKVGDAIDELDTVVKGLDVEEQAQAMFNGASIGKRIRSELLSELENVPGAKPLRRKLENLAKEWDGVGQISFAKANLMKRKAQEELAHVYKKIEGPTLSEKLRLQVPKFVREEIETSASKLSTLQNSKAFANLKEGNRLWGNMASARKVLEPSAAKAGQREFLGLKDIALGGFASGVDPASGITLALARKMWAAKGSAITAQALKKLSTLPLMERASLQVLNNVDTAVETMLNRTKRVTRLAVPISNKMLLQSSIGPQPTKKPDNRQDAVRQRIKEIEYMLADPARLAQQLQVGASGVSQAAPETAQQLAMKSMQVLKFLQAKAPKAPSKPTLTPMVDDWKIPESDVSKFERYYVAAINPMSVLSDLERGAITQEGAEALRELYPQLYQKIGQRIAEKVGTSQEKLNYQDRVQLSILFGKPMDETMTPEFKQAMTATFQEWGKPPGGEGPGGVRFQGLKNLTLGDRMATPGQAIEAKA